MTTDHTPANDPDLDRMREITEHLAAVAAPAVRAWVIDVVAHRLGGLDEERANRILDAAKAAGDHAEHDVSARLAELASIPLNDQPTTPLAILRSAYRYPTAVLAEAGARPVNRDPFEERANPEDIYGLAAGGWVDFGDEVLQAGMAWGAAKAFLHKRDRQRLEG